MKKIKTKQCECGCENCQCRVDCQCGKHQEVMHHGKSGDAVYALGIFGAAFYYFPLATNFTDYLMATLKSLAWPAMLVYQVLSLIKL